MLALYPSIELKTTLALRIGHLEGQRELLPYSALVTEPTQSLSFRGSRAPTALIVEAQVYGGARPLGLPTRTAYKPPAPAHRGTLKSHQWNEWLELPVLISQLPRDATVLLTVWGPSGSSESAVYGGAVLPLFGPTGALQQGRQKLAVALDSEPQALLRNTLAEMHAAVPVPTSPPPETSADDADPSPSPGRSTSADELDRLESLMKQHQMGEIPTIDWLDNLVFRKIESLTVAENKTAESRRHFLFVELPLWEHDVVWMVSHYADPTKADSGAFSNNQQLSASISLLKPPKQSKRQSTPRSADLDGSVTHEVAQGAAESRALARRGGTPYSSATARVDGGGVGGSSGGSSSAANGSANSNANGGVAARGESPDPAEDDEDDDEALMAVYDPDLGRETPIEAKYRRLVRLANNDRDLRPTAKVRDELQRIASFSPVHELSSDDKILLWKYRWYLTKHKSALTKFVKSVSWDDDGEAREAVEVLNNWVDINVADALELLGPEVANAQVRAYAVDRLRKASDHELELFLLQLVEALKFEPWTTSPVKSYLARFLESRVVLNAALSNNFYWYVSVQSTDRQYGATVYQPVLRHFLATLPQGEPKSDEDSEGRQSSSRMSASRHGDSASRYEGRRDSRREGRHDGRRESDAAVDATATPSATVVPPTEATTAAAGHPLRLKQVKAQVKFMNKLLDLTTLVKQSKEPRPKRIQQMRAWLADPRNEMVKFKPTVLPLDPAVTVVGCIPDQSVVFKSSMSPVKVVLRTADGGVYPMLFKSGDDLRQDQLVMQIIQLMDELLRKENLDLRLTPYRILATSMTDGAMQFIPNEPISHVISQHHGILPFLRMHAADPNEPLGVKSVVMDNFVRSSAGYAVITYILGVGDRHLENLLIDFEGHFFHIDFGYILGKDPKPFPPMIKLPIQLIDGMGGINSENYTRFRSYCFTAFTTLRKNANLILALFNLMIESTIPNIALERDQAVAKVEERFCLEMSEEEAILHFQNLINDSVNAFLPMVIDRLHSMAQYWRA